MNTLIDWVNSGAARFAFGALAYLGGGLVVAVLIGRVIRVREQQVPQERAEERNTR